VKVKRSREIADFGALGFRKIRYRLPHTRPGTSSVHVLLAESKLCMPKLCVVMGFRRGEQLRGVRKRTADYERTVTYLRNSVVGGVELGTCDELKPECSSGRDDLAVFGGIEELRDVLHDEYLGPSQTYDFEILPPQIFSGIVFAFLFSKLKP